MPVIPMRASDGARVCRLLNGHACPISPVLGSRGLLLGVLDTLGRPLFVSSVNTDNLDTMLFAPEPPVLGLAIAVSIWRAPPVDDREIRRKRNERESHRRKKIAHPLYGQMIFRAFLVVPAEVTCLLPRSLRPPVRPTAPPARPLETRSAPAYWADPWSRNTSHTPTACP
jgi:hypothetical protein